MPFLGWVKTALHVFHVLVIAVAIPGLKREPTSTVLPAAVIVQARFGDIVRDARMKVRSAVGSLEPKFVPLPIIVPPADLARYAVVGNGSVPLGVDAVIGCEVLDGVTACWCPECRLVAALHGSSTHCRREPVPRRRLPRR